MDLTDEEIAVLKRFGVTVEVKKKLPVIVERKLYKGVVTCTLCGTVTFQYIQMAKYGQELWMKERDVELEECSPEMRRTMQVISAMVGCCWHCKDVLMNKEKEVLVNMIIKAHIPAPSKFEIWKYMKELRMVEQEKENHYNIPGLRRKKHE